MKSHCLVPYFRDLPRGVARIPESGIRRIAVVGGAGRLGSAIISYLTRVGCSVQVFDLRPPDPLPGVGFTRCDLEERQAIAPGAFTGFDAVVHLGGLHGYHLQAKVPREKFWAINVHGTEQVVQAAVAGGVKRVILASSTSVFGSGSLLGHRAKVLDEATLLNPEDIYDLTKIAAERLLNQLTAGDEGVSLRFGRFFFPSYGDYQMRKLSTGLDVRDACQAIALALTVRSPKRRFYCIASDLPLDIAQRQELGCSAPDVLERALPGICDLAASRNIHVPQRVGKSVNTAIARAELGYQPERSLDWLAKIWSDEAARLPTATRFRGQPHAAALY